MGDTPDAWGNDYFDDRYFVNGEMRQFEGCCTDVFFREGMKFIKDHKDEPFFRYIATNTPHGIRSMCGAALPSAATGKWTCARLAGTR